MYKIYLISSEINDKKLYKIGYTSRNIEDRITEMKTGNAGIFEIVDYYETNNFAKNIEKSLHIKFSTKLVSGEWFDLSEDDIMIFKLACAKFHNNFKILKQSNTYIQDRKLL
jgi:hypothetical protein